MWSRTILSGTDSAKPVSGAALTRLRRSQWHVVVVGLLATMFVAGGCSWFHRWDAPTTYEFVGLEPSKAVFIEDVFRTKGVEFKQVDKEPPTYEVMGIKKMHNFAGLHRALDKAIEKNGLEVQFRSAHLHYSGLSAGGEVATTVSIAVTKGSTVHIADGDKGDPWRKIKVDSKGQWRGEVDTAGVVTQTGGWVYVHTVRGSLTRIFRVNVLSKKQERWLGKLPFEEP